jgi:hypothetical protein
VRGFSPLLLHLAADDARPWWARLPNRARIGQIDQATA